jgi:hypothetical protein
MGAGMTEPRPAKKRRWSRGKIRALAYASGLLTFVAGLGVLGYAPHPATAQSASGAREQKPRRTVIVRRITRKVIIVDQPVASAPVSYTPTYSSSGTTVSNPAPVAPAPAPTTGGSHP